MRLRAFVILSLLLAAFAATSAHAADHDVLWHIVHTQCVPEQQARQTLTPPCTKVDLAGGYAVIKDRDGATQFLTIPTQKVTGIEDATILAPNAPNYFADAWQWHGLVSERAGKPLPREDIGLAINSEYGRSQNQLHIHIDCLLPEIIAATRDHAAAVTDQWAAFPVKLLGHDYIARSVASADLAGDNPFTLLANGVPVKQADMADWTLVAVPTTVAGAPGFLLLASHVAHASGEELQDHACAVKTSG